MKHDDHLAAPSRRDFLRTTALGLGATTLGFGTAMQALAQAPNAAGAVGATGKPEVASGPYNIVFILVDQERYFHPDEFPEGYSLPGHERLMKQGTTFTNHYINSCVCTPSRSVVYTGQHIQHTKMFDNTNFPWIQSMSTELPTIGDRLRELGYYTAYKGKWHLTKEFETVNELGSPTRIFTKEMEEYGFSDYFGVGDIIAHDRGGYLHDTLFANMAVSWLRGRGMDLRQQGKPWFLAVNFVNPHDIMFLNTDRPGEVVQDQNKLTNIRPEPPNDPLYARQWTFDLPKTYSQAINAPGRPKCHDDYIRSHDRLTGNIPNEDWRWKRRHNYYLNCMRDLDRSLVVLLDEIEALGYSDNTIVILTADHGDLDGAHRLHSKGATAYREQNNVPLIVSHPAVQGGTRCQALTTHLDLAPTLLAMTNSSPEKVDGAARGLPGKDFSPVLAAPEKVPTDAVRDGALFCYNMFAYIDGDFLQQAVTLLAEGGRPALQAAIKTGFRPDMTKRGAIRSVFDGRYRFTRYFSPKQHNNPDSMEALFRLNDIELFDLEHDPLELDNLALDPTRHGALLESMNSKLNQLVENEVGEDIGQMLPGGVDAGWVATDAVNDV